MPTYHRPKINSISATVREASDSLSTTLSSSLSYSVGASISFEWKIGNVLTRTGANPSFTITGGTHGYGYYNVGLRVGYSVGGIFYWDMKVFPRFLLLKNSNARTFYFNGSGSYGAGTQANPWGNRAAFNDWQNGSNCRPGDTLCVQRGMHYQGGGSFNVKKSLHMTTYGSGANPIWRGSLSGNIFAASSRVKLSADDMVFRDNGQSTFHKLLSPSLKNCRIEDIGRVFHWHSSGRLNPTLTNRGGVAAFGLYMVDDSAYINCIVKNAHNCGLSSDNGHVMYVNCDVDMGHNLIQNFMKWSDTQMRSANQYGLNDGICPHNGRGSYLYVEGGSAKNAVEQGLDFNSPDVYEGWRWVKVKGIHVGFNYAQHFMGNFHDVIFEGCVFTDNGNPIFDRCHRIFWENNVFSFRNLRTGTSGYTKNPDVKFNNVAGSQTFFRFNTVVIQTASGNDVQQVFTFRSGAKSGSYNPIRVAGNIFFVLGPIKARQFLASFDSRADFLASGNEFEDNLFFAASGYNNFAVNNGRTYSTLANWQSNTRHDRNSKYQNPNLVGGSNYSSLNSFKLQSSSPARGMVTSNYMVYGDIYEKPYANSGNDAGAIMYGSSPTDPSDDPYIPPPDSDPGDPYDDGGSGGTGGGGTPGDRWWFWWWYYITS
jgi:hypothetical protein